MIKLYIYHIYSFILIIQKIIFKDNLNFFVKLRTHAQKLRMERHVSHCVSVSIYPKPAGQSAVTAFSHII